MNIEELKKLNILYVEDEEEVSKEIIHNLNYFVEKITYCKNGQEGIDIFLEKQEDFNLIITDVLMPILDGKQMVDQIRKINNKVPILYTTAFNNDEFLEFIGEQEKVFNLSKPIDFELLVKTMLRAIS